MKLLVLWIFIDSQILPDPTEGKENDVDVLGVIIDDESNAVILHPSVPILLLNFINR